MGAAPLATGVLVAAGGAAWESALLPLLTRPGAPVRLARRCVAVPDLLAAAAAGRAGLAVVSDQLAGWDVDAVGRLSASGVAALVVVERDTDAERSRRLGVDALVPAAHAAGPHAIVDRLVTLAARTVADAGLQVDGHQDTRLRDTGLRDTGPAPTETPGRQHKAGVVAVWGPTGAPGRSTVALGVAAAAAGRGIPALLVDADVYGGATAPMLAVLDEVSGVLAAARAASAGDLDLPTLAGAARVVAPSLRVLTGLPRPDRWTALRPPAVREMLAVARRGGGMVVVDCGFCLEQDEELAFDSAAPRRNGATTTILETADVVLVVGSADPLGLSRLARARIDLRELVPTAAVRLVVNRVRTGLGWSRDEVASTLLQAIGEVPLGFLPLDQEAVDRAWMAGRTLREAAARSALTSALDTLAHAVAIELGLAVPAGHRATRGTRRRPRRPAPVTPRR